MTLNIVDAQAVVQEKTKDVNIPTDIYLTYPNEDTKTQLVTDSFDFFKLLQIISKLKTDNNILHESLKKKSNVFIFGAGGTTSWFLPKLLKIYNDAFNKVPTLRYDLNIILVDADQVRI